MWGMIGATFEMRGVVEGHGSGLHEPHDASAFAATASPRITRSGRADEAWNRLIHGQFVELRPLFL